MKALQREMGDVEITEESVREYIAKMTPEQRLRLQNEGKDLKRELLTNDDHKEELQVFRKEVNAKAEAAGLPVEKDGEHLGRKLLTHMRTSTEAPPHFLVLEAIASCSFLVKLAVAEAREGAPKAAPEDLTTIEEGLRRLKVHGWRNEEEEAGRAPFVRRNLLLLHFVLYCEKIELSLQESTQSALSELQHKVKTIADMLFQYCLQNRWVKAALTVTEVMAMLVSGVWDHKDDECRELMKSKWQRQGLKVPKLTISANCADVEAGAQAKIKVEVGRLHAYSAEELAELLKDQGPTGAGKQAEQPTPKEGWWVIAEGIRTQKGADKAKCTEVLAGEEELSHNSLVGGQVLACGLDEPAMACEITFEAPANPGEYKVMVHVRNTGCAGVDVRRKVTFQVKQPYTGRAKAAAVADDVPELD